MKKFLTAACSVILLLLLLDTAYYRWGFYIDFHGGEEPSSFTAVRGKEILVDQGDGLLPYEIRGVDMGAGIPGHFATEFAIDKDTYLRWFGMIQDMGANTIRIYTILSEDFYNAFYEYNKDNPDPLYLLHGVWVNDYVLNSHVDAYDASFADALKRDVKKVVDIIHGRKKNNLGYGATDATGSYTKDISPWVLGYILGVEWEDVTVAYTDHMEPDKNQFHGDYMYTSEEATPFEALLASVGDEVIRYETDKYREQRLVAFSNWPTTDPIDYPERVNYLFQKCAQVDVEHIKTTDRFISGQFASYHVYPYYPDYLNLYEEWKQEIGDADRYALPDGGTNTYAAYLSILNRHHTMPVIISEFGVPTSRGRAQRDFNTGRSQGHMSEQEQGEALVSSYRDIMEAGCAGSVIFTWQDEWFKRTWNTMANVDLLKTAYWSDYQTNEQYFGLLSFDPGEKESVCYTDGEVDEWSESDLLQDRGDIKLYGKYDEKYLYFRIHADQLDFENEIFYIPFDITPKSGSYYAQGEDVKFDRPADFLLIFDGKENSRFLVQERYDAFRAIFSEDYGMENPFRYPPDKDSPVFEKIYLALQLVENVSEMTEQGKNVKSETGKLVYGNGNPHAEEFNSMSDFIVSGDEIELRLPWQLLNFSNPSEMQIHDDYFENYGIENLGIDRIYLGVGRKAEKGERINLVPMRLKGWGKHPTYHERLKRSYYRMQELWADGASDERKDQ